MSGVKFYVLGGGRWREIDLSSGHIDGWGAARFLSLRGGRLRVEGSAPVLRGLRALAAGRPTTAHDGTTLEQIRYDEIVEQKHQPCHGCLHDECQPCCQHSLHRCSVTSIADQPSVRAAPGNSRVSHIAVQTDPTSNERCEPTSNGRSEPTSNERCEPTSNGRSEPTSNGRCEPTSNGRCEPTSNERSEPTSNGRCEPTSNRRSKLRGHPRGAAASHNTSRVSREGLGKELIITEEEVELLRNFIEKDERNVFDVDLELYDADDAYKRKVFFKLNPLVEVERWPRGQLRSAAELQDFMSTLGLRRVELPGDRDKENRGDAPDDPPAQSDAQLSPGHRRGPWREYSLSEDKSILRWVSEEQRARRVNGNTLWRELQELHYARTGRSRTWQSLRNRYLRYLLPSVSSLLSPRRAAELRAAAARRPPPIPPAPPLTSAWSRRPRNPRRESSSSPNPLNGSPVPSTPSSSDRRHGKRPERPRRGAAGPKPSLDSYVDLVKKFADRHPRAGSDVSHTDDTKRRSSKRLRLSRNGTGRPADTADTADRHAKRSPDTNGRRVPRTRRLFNPNS